jgi:hypothetical protein
MRGRLDDAQITRAMMLIVTLALTAACGGHGATAAPQVPTAASALANAEPSVDALITRFLDALAEKDRRALEAMRVNKREYIDIIMPGTIEPGKERRRFPEDKATYFWDVLNTKSLYSELALLNSHGGRHYTVRDVSWAKGVQHFDGYTGYAQLRLTVQDERGESHEIETGSVAEVAGRYKFISFIRD